MALSVFGRARSALSHFLEHVWSRDRARLGMLAGLMNRVLRILGWTARGLLARRLSRQAASLTYYTVFSIVPVLVVVLWVLNALGYLGHLATVIPTGWRETLKSNPLLN